MPTTMHFFLNQFFIVCHLKKSQVDMEDRTWRWIGKTEEHMDRVPVNAMRRKCVNMEQGKHKG